MITKINGVDNNYLSQNKKISFKSKIVPNETIKGVFSDARVVIEYLKSGGNTAQYGISLMYIEKTLFNAIKNILNNGKNELMELTKSKNGKLGYKLNGKKAKLNKSDMLELASKDVRTITNEEFDIISSLISKLKDDLNADYESKNPGILANLHKNVQEIDNIFLKHTVETLDQLEKQIFKNR